MFFISFWYNILRDIWNELFYIPGRYTLALSTSLQETVIAGPGGGGLDFSACISWGTGFPAFFIRRTGALFYRSHRVIAEFAFKISMLSYMIIFLNSAVPRNLAL